LDKKKPKLEIVRNTKPGPPDAGQVATIVRSIRQHTLQYLRPCLEELNTELGQSLLDKANYANTNTLQSDLFYALNTFEKNGLQIDRQFLDHAAEGISLLQHPDKLSHGAGRMAMPDSMELIDKNDFDEWVLAVAVAQSAEQNILHDLLRLERKLVRLTGTHLNSETNPLSPQSLLRFYKQSLAEYEIEVSAKQEIYTLFGKLVLSRLPELYTKLDDYLQQQGIHSEHTDSRIRNNTPALSNKEDSAQQPAPELHRKRNALDILSSMALPGSISQQITEFLRSHVDQYGEPVMLDERERGIIEATGQFLTVLRQDQRYDHELRSLLDKLEIPLIKGMVNDPELLSDAQHPGHKLLEVIDQLAPYCQTDAISQHQKSALYTALDNITRTIEEGGDACIEKASNEVETLAQIQQDQFTRNASIVVESSESLEAEKSARLALYQQLEDPLGDQEAPFAVQQLLSLGWLEAVLQLSMTTEQNNTDAGGYFDLIFELGRSFTKESGHMFLARQQMAEMMRKGFALYPLHAAAVDEFITRVNTSLLGDKTVFQELATPVLISKHELQKLLGLRDTETVPMSETAAAEQIWLQRVKQLETEDWIVEQRQEGQARMINLAWKSPQTNRFVFVDGSGQKILDTSDLDLAREFEQGHYAALEDKKMPLLERTVQRLLKQTFEHIREEVDQDKLTGAMNRRGFEREISKLIHSVRSGEESHVIIIMDVDHFSMINDLCGFEGGDNLLFAILGTIKAYMENLAVVARTGDDEFGILVNNATIDEGFRFAEKLRLALEDLHYSWRDVPISLSVSVGVTAFAESLTAGVQPMQEAYAACTMAKQEGRNCCRIYSSSEFNFEQRNRLIKSMSMIEETIEKNRMLLYVQPIVPVFANEDEAEHYEILLRVLDEDDKPGNPVAFIQAAERYGRIRSVDRWVINTFCSWLRESKHHLSSSVRFSINLSGQSLVDDEFAEFLVAKISESPISPDRIAFEITETSYVSQMSRVNSIMARIKSFGCKFYLDDFGSGYASYSYLKDIPVDYVKIDGCFVKDIAKDSTSYAMVKSIVEIAHFMDKKVIAEYVENAEILKSLHELNVDFAQGYEIGKPMPLEHLDKHSTH